MRTFTNRIIEQMIQSLLHKKVALFFAFTVISSVGFAQIAPGGVTGETLWLRADSLATSSSWGDVSGSANNMNTNPSGFSMKTINFNPSYTFNGTTNVFKNNSTTGINNGKGEKEIYYVSVSSGGGDFVFYGGNVDNELLSLKLSESFSALRVPGSGSDGNNRHDYPGDVGNVPNIRGFSLAQDAYLSNTVFIYNGTESGGIISGSDIQVNVTNPFVNIGRRFQWPSSDPADKTVTGYFGGQIAEVIYYPDNNTPANRQKIQSYLALKYGITLEQGSSGYNYVASNDAVIWNASGTSTSGYNNDIFGIGRDTTSALDQRVSKSANFDGIITISSGTDDFEAANSSGTRTQLNDFAFQTIANNGGASSWTATDAPSGYYILGRAWQVQETGNVGDVYLQFDVNDNDFNVYDLISGNKYYIIFDTNDNGSFADETPVALTETSFNSGLWNTVAYDFSGGEIFTLATSSIDTDGDTVYDIDDFDDDNDGISDVTENACSRSYGDLTFSIGSPSVTEGTAAEPKIVTYTGTFTDSDGGSGTWSLKYDGTTQGTDDYDRYLDLIQATTGNGGPGLGVTTVNSDATILAGGADVFVFTIESYNGDADLALSLYGNAQNSVDGTYGAGYDSYTIDYSPSSIYGYATNPTATRNFPSATYYGTATQQIRYNSISGTYVQTGDIIASGVTFYQESGEWRNQDLNWYVDSKKGLSSFTLTALGAGGIDGFGFRIQTVTETPGCDGADLDDDGVFNSFDLDSDGDGCYDVVEVYGTTSDTDNDGVYGTGSPTVDGDGLITAIGVTSQEYDNVASLPLTSNSNYEFNEADTAFITTQPAEIVYVEGGADTIVASVAALAATLYSNGSPDYSQDTIDVSDSLSFQWYENSVAMADGGVYSGTTNDTLIISDNTGLAGNVYFCIITHTSNNCIELLYETTLKNPGEDFISTWNISNGSTVVMPIDSVTGNNIVVDWGDGSLDTLSPGNSYPSHTYTSEPTDTIEIYPLLAGDFSRGNSKFTLDFSNAASPTSNDTLITEIVQWGENQYTTLANAFSACSKLDVTATDVPLPDVSANISMAGMFANCTMLQGIGANWAWDSITPYVNNMEYMFSYAIYFNQDIGNWDVSHVSTFTGMFQYAYSFNQNLGAWSPTSAWSTMYMFLNATSFNSPVFSSGNTGSISWMNQMFNGATSFNQDIDNWNVNNVLYMDGMFWVASAFNQDLDSWNVSNVRTMTQMFRNTASFNGDITTWTTGSLVGMYGMFQNAPVFNRDISSWDVSNVENMALVFAGATAFNQDIGGWDVSESENMNSMFYRAYAFNQNLEAWCIDSLATATNMLDSCGMRQTNYDALLLAWADSATANSVTGVPLGAAGLTYCDGEPGRTSLTTTSSWTITGDKHICYYYSPGGVSDELQLWVRADKGTGTSVSSVGTEGNTVSTWYDQSPNTNDVTNADINHTYAGATANFNPTVNMVQAMKDFITTNDLAAQEIFVAVQHVSPVSWTGVIGVQSEFRASGETGIRLNTAKTAYQSVVATDWTYGGGTLRINATDNNYVHNGLFHIVDGQAPDTITDQMYLGGYYNSISNRYFDGYYAEAIIYSANTSVTDRQKIESYLALKYGITLNRGATDYLASDSTVMWDASESIGYTHDIFGIGRDDVDSLDQRISKSVNDSAIVTISSGIPDFTTANLSGGRTQLPDLAFQTIANNGGAATWNDEGATGEITYNYLYRKWKVQETGTVGDVYLQFNVADAEFDVPALLEGDTYYIVFDTDGDGTFADETPRPLAETPSHSGLWYSVPYNFTGGEVFTLATESGYADTDGDGVSDVIDLDDDNDGIRDDIENVCTQTYGDLTFVKLSNTNGTFTDAEGNTGNWTLAYTGTGILNSVSIFNNTGFNINTSTNSTHTDTLTFSISGYTGGEKLSVTIKGKSDSFGANIEATGYDFIFVPSTIRAEVLTPNGEIQDVASNLYSAGDIIASGITIYTVDGTPSNAGDDNLNWKVKTDYSADLTSFTVVMNNSQWAECFSFSIEALAETDGCAGNDLDGDGTNNSMDYDSDGDGCNDVSEVYGSAVDNAGVHSAYTGTASVNSNGLITSLLAASSDSTYANEATIPVVTATATGNYSFLEADTAYIKSQPGNIMYEKDSTANFIVDVTALAATLYSNGSPNYLQDSIDASPGLNFQWYENGALMASETDDTLSLTMAEALIGNKYYCVITHDDDSCITLLSDTVYIDNAPGGVVGNLALWVRADKKTDEWTSNNYWFDFHNLDTCIINGATLNTVTSLHNFNPGVEFSAGNSIYVYEGFYDFSKGLSAFVMAEYTTSGANCANLFDLGQGQGNDNVLFGRAYGTTSTGLRSVVWLGNSQNVGQSTDPMIVYNQNTIFGLSMEDGNPGVSTIATYYANGLNSGTDNIPIPYSVNRDKNFIGNSNWDDNFVGDIPEVIIYNRELTATEQQKVNSYLAIKYGITLDSGKVDYLASSGDTVWSVADNDTTLTGNVYNNDIFGLGRDDADALDQRVSHSVNNSAILAVALQENFSASNVNTAVRTTDFDNNQQFMMFSNNGGDTVVDQTTNVVSGFKRMDRMWRVSKTANFSQPVYLDFGATYASSPVGEKYYIVVKSGDDDFRSGAARHQEINDQGHVTAFTFNDNDYFTIVKVDTLAKAPGGINYKLMFWLRADMDIDTSATGEVNHWHNQTNGFDSVFADTGNEPEIINNIINFNPAVSFDAAQDMFLHNHDAQIARGAEAKEAYVVTRVSAVTPSNTAFTICDLGNASVKENLSFEAYDAANAFYHFGTSGQIRVGHEYSGVANPYEYYYRFGERELITNGEFAVNGALASTHDGNSTYNDGHTNTDSIVIPPTEGIYIGGHENVSGHDVEGLYTGDIAEIIYYDTINSGASRQIIESYLAIKYGITLDQSVNLSGTGQDYIASDSTIVWDADSFLVAGNYVHDIFGLGRDDYSNLVQRVSKSENSTAVLTASLDDDFVSPNSPVVRSSGLDDLEFMVFSDNGADTLFTSDFHGGKNNRMNRVWAADVTGDPDSVFVAIPNSFVFPSGNKVVIVAGNSSLDSNVRLIELTDDGTHLFAKIPVVANTDFWFTFASFADKVDMKYIMRHGKYFKQGEEQPMEW